jgi:hypothetical protein
VSSCCSSLATRSSRDLISRQAALRGLQLGFTWHATNKTIAKSLKGGITAPNIGVFIWMPASYSNRCCDTSCWTHADYSVLLYSLQLQHHVCAVLMLVIWSLGEVSTAQRNSRYILPSYANDRWCDTASPVGVVCGAGLKGLRTGQADRLPLSR